jgi:hypothetical protein
MLTTKILSSKIMIEADPEVVFRAVTDWELQSEWVLGTKVRGVGDESHRLGGKIEAFTGIGSIGFLDTMTITQWNPPYLCEVTHTGKTVRGSGLFEVTSENGMTYFTWTEYTEIPFGIIGRNGWVFVAPIAKLGLNISLRRFKKIF